MMAIAGYQVSQILYESAKSIVYRGRAKSGDPVIIKTPANDNPGPRQIARFQRAFDVGVCADAEAVVRHIDLVRYQSSVALVTEDFDGVPLSSVIPERGFRLGPLINISLALATALARLHASGFLHKDVKPDNVLINTRSYALRFIDLGIATRLNREAGQVKPDIIEGALQYAAPEHFGCMDSQVDDRADLYSLGVTLFHIATGTLPFCEKEPAAWAHAHVALPHPVLSEVRKDLPVVFSEIVSHLLNKHVDDRYASAAGLVHDLRECLSSLNQTGTIRNFPIAANDISPLFRIPDKLYGRQTQRSQIFEAFQQTWNGKRTLVKVTGRSGIGKTAFVNHVQRLIVTQGGMFCSGKFDQFHPDRPYLGILKAFREMLRTVLAAPEATFHQYRNRLQEAVGIYGRLLTDDIPELAAIIGSQPGVDEIAPLAAARRFQGLVARFLQVFAAPQSPVVFFIDDLQWADPASINLLEAMASMQQLDHLLLITGYRSNELGPGHPAHRALDALGAAAANNVSIELGPLAESDITALVADTLHIPPAEADVLGKRVHDVAAGNVFFAREFLHALRQRKFFSFDEESRKWAWDIQNLSSHAMPVSVAAILIQRLSEIPAPCLEMLETASCVGGEFDLRTLSSAQEIGQSEAAIRLGPAIQNGLVLPLDANHNVFESLAASGLEKSVVEGIETARYRFQHDQVRLAVHNNLGDEQRKQRHLRIGRLLFGHLSNTELSTRAIEVFGHLTDGIDLITEANERLAFAELGLDAGRVAQRGLAFDVARTMLIAAASLLPDTAWDKNYKLAMGINLGLAETAFALGNQDEFEVSIQRVLVQARTPIDAARAQGLLVRVRTTQTRYAEAVDIGIKAAHSLGVALPRKPKLVHVLAGMTKALLTQGRKDPLDFENQHETADPAISAAINLLSNTANAAYFAEPNLMPLIGTTSAHLALRHGVSPSSSYGLAIWAMALCSLGLIDRGYQFGMLALSVGRRYGGVEEARTRFVVDGMVRQWKEPLAEVAVLAYQNWGTNRDSGDEESAVYSSGILLWADFFAGQSVDADLRYPDAVAFNADSNIQHVKDIPLAWAQLFVGLRADELPSELSGQWFDLAVTLPKSERENNHFQIAVILIAAGILDYFAGRNERAEERFARAAKLQKYVVSLPLVSGLAFYRALNAYRLLAQQPTNRGLLLMARRQTHRLRKWARFAPVNLDCRVSLLTAEEHIVKGRAADAVMSLHQAIDQASNGAILYQALAERRLSEFLAAAENASQAQAAAGRAQVLFKAWGSTALANPPGSSASTATGTYTTSLPDETQLVHREGMDLHSLLEAVRTISSELNKDALLERIMFTVMQSAGADRGVFILIDADGRAIVEFVADTDNQTRHPGISLADFKEIAHPAVDLALRAGNIVRIDDAQHSDIVSSDRHTQDTHVRSILASRIVLQNRTTGLIYLENHVAKGAFTAGRGEMIEALGAQAGIVLEKARLYQKTQDDLATQTVLTVASRRFVPTEFLTGLGCSSIVDVRLSEASEQEMSVLFADLRSFTELSKQLGPSRTIKMINRYLSYVQPGIAANRGFVGQYYGDGVLALFPGEASAAIHGAIAMCRGLDAYNWEREDFPALRFGIGIHYGPITMGTIGDPDHFQCGVIGDSVNLASRIEALTKFYGATLLVSGATYRRIDTSQILAHRHLGRVQVQGRSEVIDVYECLDAYAERKRETLVKGQEIFGEAIAAYNDGQWTRAGISFNECIRVCPDDRVSLTFRERCQSRGLYPIDWDGIERPEKHSS